MNHRSFPLLLAVALASEASRAPRAHAEPTTSGQPTPARSEASATAPRILFEARAQDLGKVDGNDTVRGEFTFMNRGNSVLEIKNVKASCSCLESENWTREVKPGMTGVIPVEFHTGNYRGPVSETLTVECNDPQEHSVVLVMHASVWRAIDLTPPSAKFDLVPGSSTNGTVVKISNNEEKPLELSALKCDQPSLLTTLREVKPGREFELRIRARPAGYKGNLFGRISIKTSSLKVPVLEIPVFGLLRNPPPPAPIGARGGH